ncbi:MAG TPA: phosphonoacetate hydrolase [Casimicrobiaceae bacterium]|jgi:phosphonoacetate hydrolase|nr:phosphonoacetate hydrolase [Casimicrobiaceae bacterium]
MARADVRLNGITYRWPTHPVVVVCIDGGDHAYFERGQRDGIIPTVDRFIRTGFSATAEGTVPSFTCPNNMSIATGAPASVHGISGNFYLDPETGEAVVMTGPELLRSGTILGGFSRSGARVVSITAKDKLRQQLGKDFDLSHGSSNFSSQCADECRPDEHGIENVLGLVGMPLPDMYSMELSLFVLEAGARLLEKQRPDLMYLSLSDYVQHKYAPGEPEANRFYQALDDMFARLDASGAVVALTADHGMNDKSKPDGSPNVIWLQDHLDASLGRGTTTVICPITDRFVGHHGALGGFVRVYCRNGTTRGDVMRVIATLPGIEAVLEKEDAARRFELPLDREGDVVVISDRGTCIGGAEAEHDLSGLAGHRLRTHGGVSESHVPFIFNRPLTPAYAERARAGGLKSHSIFDFALNGLESA